VPVCDSPRRYTIPELHEDLSGLNIEEYVQGNGRLSLNRLRKQLEDIMYITKHYNKQGVLIAVDLNDESSKKNIHDYNNEITYTQRPSISYVKAR
jgi:hypothetical protein